MNILVTGANGQLGNEMRIVSQNTTDRYIFTDVNQVEGLETTYLDITDMDAIRKMVKENDVNVIVNCAAWTNVDACETDEKLAALAEKLNADAPENLAQAMKEVNGLPPTMCSARNPTMCLAVRSRRARLRAYMARPSCMASRRSSPRDASMSSSARLGCTLSLARTSARRCLT